MYTSEERETTAVFDYVSNNLVDLHLRSTAYDKASEDR
ncbi:hypothetical protein SAMN04488542_10556 [Fontibacillus panacisegetis]|uniref:Uncharacterized protein n=1 Tax=Fontibacillus panacisegetis TaxID=670482 RepID=A0A1G7HWW5_9BACL|nr:hypothetical protein SAMN04488542_10556 [Fontibacillus panacisegetis]